MLKLLKKEFTLSASPITYFFLAFTLMTFIPNYPVTIGAFWLCLGLFYTFQRVREENDLTFTALLPVRKTDAVTAKYFFCIILQVVSAVSFGVFAILRKTIADAIPGAYESALLIPNLTAAGFYLLTFACFNVIFLGGFFKTAYKLGKPLILFCVAALIAMAFSEILVHLPGLDLLNDYGRKENVVAFAICCVIYGASSVASLKYSQKTFEKLDL